MKFILMLSDVIIPLTLVYIIAYGISKKTDIYRVFTEGAYEGFKIVVNILPTLIGLMTAVGILRASGVFLILEKYLSPFCEKLGIPSQTVPLAFLRLISSSAGTGILLDIFKTNGTDSFEGRFVSVMMYCTESMIYVMSVYFMSIGVKKTRYTILGGVLANFAGIIGSYILCKILF